MPPDQQTPAPTPPLPEINIDFAPIGKVFVQALSDNAGQLGNAMWAAFSNWLYTGLRNLFMTLFEATLLTIPHELTDRFKPVTDMMPNSIGIAGAAAALAMILLGLKVILQRVPIQTAIVEEVIGRIVVYIGVLGALPWIISRAIDVEQQMAKSITIQAIESIVWVPAGAMDFTQLVALVVMVILGVRLWFKLAANVVHVAGAVLWSPLAMACGLFPQGGWIASMWWHEFLGRLAGAVLATAAVGLGLAIALRYPGMLSIAGGGGAFIAAADLVDWLARTPGQRVGGVLGVLGGGVQGGLMMARGTGAGAVAGAVMGAAIPQNEITTRAEQFGYD